MVFVTVGSQKFPFDRLLQAVDECVAQGVIVERVFAQTGKSGYSPLHYEGKPFLGRDEFARQVDGCSVLITHGGTGAIIGALRKRKTIIAMPRLARFGEHVDDHQVQLLTEFERREYILTCQDADTLASAYARSSKVQLRRYNSNNARFIEDIDRYLSEGALGL